MGRALAELPVPGEPAGEWVRHVYRVPDPGAGSTWKLAVPGEFDWLLLSISQLFGTSAAVATRAPFLRVRDETRELWRVPFGSVVAANANVQHTYSRDVGAVIGSVTEGNLTAPLPGLPLAPGMVIDQLCFNLQAADVFSLINVMVLERFTGARPPRRGGPLGLVEPLDLGATLDV